MQLISMQPQNKGMWKRMRRIRVTKKTSVYFNEGTAVQYVDTFLDHMDQGGAITVILECQVRFKLP